MRFLPAILLFALAGCELTDSASKNALDEELLATTLVEKLDERKEGTVRLVREEAEKLGESLSEDIRKNVIVPTLDFVDTSLKQMEERLTKKHEEFIARLPWYLLYIFVMISVVAILSDVGVEIIRWLLSKKGP